MTRIVRGVPVSDAPRMAWWWLCGAVAGAAYWFADGLMSHRHQVYIGSRYWREHVRPQVFARDGRRGDIHHLGYGRQWREDLDDLVTVTRVLHKRIEEEKRDHKQQRRRRAAN